MKVLNFGSCNIDRVHAVDHVCKVGETIASHGVEIFPGGKGLNQSVALSRAGANTYHAGCIGEDGSFLKELLQESGVNVEHLSVVDGLTGYAMIQVEKSGDNCIVLFGGANQRITEGQVDEALKGFARGDYLVLQNEINRLSYIVDKGYEKGMEIVLNPSPFRAELLEIDYRKIAYLIVNETEAFQLSRKDTVEEFVRFVRENYPHLRVVLTLGGEGSAYIDREEYVKQRAFKVDAVDTTGAGDTFLGYFTAEVMQGSTPKTALTIASVASSIAVSRKGASSSIPTREEVMRKIEEMGL